MHWKKMKNKKQKEQDPNRDVWKYSFLYFFLMSLSILVREEQIHILAWMLGVRKTWVKQPRVCS